MRRHMVSNHQAKECPMPRVLGARVCKCGRQGYSDAGEQRKVRSR